jgi:hypothetical protein
MALTPILAKLLETVTVFVRHAPDPRALWASRTGEFERTHVILPSTAVAGEELDLTVLAWDRYERLVEDFDGALTVDSTDPEADVPGTIRFEGGVPPEDGDRAGRARATVTFETSGIQYRTLERDGERFVSNPVEVLDEEPEEGVYWGDIHLHTQFSDGVDDVAKGLRYGRDVMALDVVAYTDHDTMGFFIPPTLQRRRMRQPYFDETGDLIREHHDPGRFVTLFGYEWTKQPNVGGHVNVNFDGVEEGERVSSSAGWSQNSTSSRPGCPQFGSPARLPTIRLPGPTAHSSAPRPDCLQVGPSAGLLGVERHADHRVGGVTGQPTAM